MARPEKGGSVEYWPDSTLGITRPDELPKPITRRLTRSAPRRSCPACGRSAYRVRDLTRTLHDIGDLRSGRPVDLLVTYSQHKCPDCRFHFCSDLSDLALPRAGYTRAVQSLALRSVVEDGLSYRAASWRLWRDHRVFVPFATIQGWVEGAGKKGGPRG